MIPRLQFDIDITNDSDNQQILIFGWSGGLSLQYPQYLQISDLSTGFEFVSIDAKAKSKIKTSCEVSHEKLDIIEDLRKGENLQIAINLNILNSLIPKSAPPPHGISQIRCDSVWVKPVSGEDKIVIPRSIWDDRLEELNYGTIMTLRFAFPPPPLGTLLDKSIEFIKDAQKKINDGEWSDSLSSCRKSIEELQKIIGHDEEKQKEFFQNLLKDEEKAKDCKKLWDAIQKAENFASGGPHTYWVKTADKRDAELAIRVVSAFVHYFAKNLARTSAS
jgi:hypothetical protein